VQGGREHLTTVFAYKSLIAPLSSLLTLCPRRKLMFFFTRRRVSGTEEKKVLEASRKRKQNVWRT